METVLAKLIGYKMSIDIIVNLSDYNPYHAILYGDSPGKRELEKFKRKKYLRPSYHFITSMENANLKSIADTSDTDYRFTGLYGVIKNQEIVKYTPA